jgi:hypothetical protein
MTRTNYTQLPDKQDAKDIFNKEARRNTPKNKINKNFFEFDFIINLAKHFNIDYSFFINNYTKEDMLNKEIFQKGEEFINEFKNKVLNKQITNKDKEILDCVYDYLAEEDAPEKSDILFVFGAKK